MRLFRVGTSSRSAGTFSCGERVVGVGKAKKNNKAVAWRSSLLYSEASFVGLDRVNFLIVRCGYHLPKSCAFAISF